jgi:transposase-like protein
VKKISKPVLFWVNEHWSLIWCPYCRRRPCAEWSGAMRAGLVYYECPHCHGRLGVATGTFILRPYYENDQ